ncbi:MAG: CheR family methyltransferase, partial [Bacteroidota bacterium]
MNHAIPDNLLSMLSKVIADTMGLHFPRERWKDLERSFGSVAREYGFQNAESCARWLLSSNLLRQQLDVLASHLTVGETYFFREKNCFKLLEDQILSPLIQSRRSADRRLRIWSAGCCTGEEPYSIAMVLRNLIPELTEWNVSLIATDINPRFLRRASEGVYGEWSFRETPAWIKEKYFKRIRNGQYELLSSVRRMVTFGYLNLVEDSYPSLLTNTNAMDIIFCRNVLMYFTPEQAKKVVKKLHRCLMDGGWLVVSPSETSQLQFSEFNTVNFPDATFYRKEQEKKQAARDFFFPVEHEAEPPEHVLYKVPDIIQTVHETFSQQTLETVNEPHAAADEHDIYAAAFMAYEHGHYAEATDKVLAELSRHPNDARLLTLLARIQANEGRLTEALEVCHKALDADKLSPANHFLLATILQEHGQTERAVNSLKKVLYL